jgi:hypothetical protein
MSITEHLPKAHLLVCTVQQVLTVTPIPSVLQLRPECPGRPVDKTHTLTGDDIHDVPPQSYSALIEYLTNKFPQASVAEMAPEAVPQ